MDTNVYIDGFNLYYGILAGKPEYRWLDLGKLCETILPDDNIRSIKYYTAIVKSTQQNPGKTARQKTYIRALETIENLNVCYGKFKVNECTYLTVAGKEPVRVYKPEEKCSDVNLASHLLYDAFQNSYEKALVLSNDSDFQEAFRIVAEKLNKVVWTAIPENHFFNRNLVRWTHGKRFIRGSAFRKCQFPEIMSDRNGVFRKPDTWKLRLPEAYVHFAKSSP